MNAPRRPSERRVALRSMGALCLLLGSGRLAFGASIVAVRVWPASDYTRASLVVLMVGIATALLAAVAIVWRG